MKLRKFPYAITFKEFHGQVLIFAVRHLHRRPNYWHDRLKDRES